ncbi:unnamed protein product [Arctogadus glacialis]
MTVCLEEDPFVYNYESLRIGGLTFAVVLFTLGILLILSRRCRCNINQKSSTPGNEEANEENPIVTKGLSATPMGPFPGGPGPPASPGTPGLQRVSQPISGSSELMNVSPSDYETLRIGGLVLAGIIVVMSVFLLFGNKIRTCGKSKARPVEED